ncbi:PREDICTED: uncharacterized protein LOC106726630 isoform X1 [Myotis brandtii]|uniref:uncharacterized protein LOC106726630 isoform X1 n=1 Tax=Myotis brandtii TaxID=109478 RepID=UPI000703DB0F|nr:PREDICTED: uncharacterized protein LOC106726630 isoform X1 [Myotis brandtii]
MAPTSYCYSCVPMDEFPKKLRDRKLPVWVGILLFLLVVVVVGIPGDTDDCPAKGEGWGPQATGAGAEASRGNQDIESGAAGEILRAGATKGKHILTWLRVVHPGTWGLTSECSSCFFSESFLSSWKDNNLVPEALSPIWPTIYPNKYS